MARLQRGAAKRWMAVGKVHEAYDCRVGRAAVLGRIDREGVQILRSRLGGDLRLRMLGL